MNSESLIGKMRSRIYEFWLLLAINNGDVTPMHVNGTPPMLRLNQSYREQHTGQGPEIREVRSYTHLHGHFWLGVFIVKKALHPIGIGVGIAGAARLFGWI